jgi:hypothetical protein
MRSVTIQPMRRHSIRTVVAGLLLPVLLFRAWIPIGFMPVATADSGAALVVCPGVQHHHGVPSPSGEHGVPCVFTASAGAAPTPAILALVPCSLVTVAARPGIAVVFFVPSILRSQSSRAPPLLG